MFGSRFSARSLCVSLVSLMFAVGTASAQNNVKVNPTLQPGETVSNYKSSADGRYAVFTVSKVENYATVSSRLYSFDTTTNSLKALTPALGGNTEILQYEIAPNNSRVVYRADQTIDNRFDVYSVPVTGGTATRITRFASNEADATDFKISPDSSRVVYKYYISPEDGDSTETLVSVATAGGTNTRIAPAQPGAYLNEFFFTPDGSRVAFQFEAVDADSSAFYSVAPTGGAIAFLTDRYYGDSYAISPDSQSFVYVADFEDDYVLELYSTPIKGGARVKLSQANEDVQGFKFTPPYAAAVYAYKSAAETNVYNPNAFGIVSLDARYRYNIRAGREFSSYGWQVSPDNRGIVFTSEELVPNEGYRNELYSITLDSRGAVRKLSDSPLTRGVADFKVSPDGSRVVFLAYPTGGFALQLFSVPTIDGGVTKISNVTYNTADPYSGVQNRFEFSGDGKRIVFAYTPQIATTGVDLLSVGVAGGTVSKTAANVDDDFNNFFRVAGSSNRVLYTRTTYSFNEETFYTTTTTELFASAIR